MPTYEMTVAEHDCEEGDCEQDDGHAQLAAIEARTVATLTAAGILPTVPPLACVGYYGRCQCATCGVARGLSIAEARAKEAAEIVAAGNRPTDEAIGARRPRTIDDGESYQDCGVTVRDYGRDEGERYTDAEMRAEAKVAP